MQSLYQAVDIDIIYAIITLMAPVFLLPVSKSRNVVFPQPWHWNKHTEAIHEQKFSLCKQVNPLPPHD